MKDGENDPTLPSHGELTAPTGKFDLAEIGYELGAVLGSGGMGEVLAAYDPKMGREVALKRLRGDEPSDEAVRRFLREAKIQARLDHPSIVPVHELGEDADGRPFFVMKRLAGTTLTTRLADGESTQRLLRAMIDVCLAIDLAHSRGIVHRDLKPANIMLGNYGEVYVLDWGVARVLDRVEQRPTEKLPSIDQMTQAGTLMGTPGYMAPEQVVGEEVGTAADVYALGAITFEILADEPLHPRGAAALASTLQPPELSPATRRPDRTIAPELDDLCKLALATDAAGRPTARQFADRLQLYLDGDRDLERRRALANEELAAARASLARGDRATTIFRAGRAVTLDPSCTDAIQLATTLILEPADKLPPDAAATAVAEEVATTRRGSRRALVPVLSFFLITPVLPLFSIKSWSTLGIVYLAVTLQAIVSLFNWRVRLVPLWVFLGVQLFLVVAFSRIASPFILTPVVTVAMLLSFTSRPWLIDRRWAVLGWTALATVLPFVLEGFGVFARSWEMLPEGILLHGNIFAGRTAIDAYTMMVANIVIVSIVGFYALDVARDRRKAERQLYAQAWHLQQLLPREGT